MSDFEENAADGGRRHPAASTLADLIIMMRDGQFNADSVVTLHEFTDKLQTIGIDTVRKAKGTITLKIEVEFDPDREFCVVTPSLTTKLPAEKHGATVAWFDEDAQLTPNKPNQGNLFGTIREVNLPAREVRG